MAEASYYASIASEYCQISKYRVFSTLKLISTKAQKSYDHWYSINPEASWVKKDSFSGCEICVIMSRQAGFHGLKLEDLGTSLSLSLL